jgi:hypothetical protein
VAGSLGYAAFGKNEQSDVTPSVNSLAALYNNWRSHEKFKIYSTQRIGYALHGKVFNNI